MKTSYTHLRELLANTPHHEKSARNLHRGRHNRTADPSQRGMYNLQQSKGLHKNSRWADTRECRLGAAVDGLQGWGQIRLNSFGGKEPDGLR